MASQRHKQIHKQTNLFYTIYQSMLKFSLLLVLASVMNHRECSVRCMCQRALLSDYLYQNYICYREFFCSSNETNESMPLHCLSDVSGKLANLYITVMNWTSEVHLVENTSIGSRTWYSVLSDPIGSFSAPNTSIMHLSFQMRKQPNLPCIERPSGR